MEGDNENEWQRDKDIKQVSFGLYEWTEWEPQAYLWQ
jgi:hypothetical protein